MSSHNICADLSQHSTVCIDTGRPIADIQQSLLAGSGNSRPTDVANCGDIYPKSSFMCFLSIEAIIRGLPNDGAHGISAKLLLGDC